MLHGIGVSDGIGCAPALLYTIGPVVVPDDPARDPQAEAARFQDACQQVKERLTDSCGRALETAGEKGAEIFEAHIAILEDEDSVLEPIAARITQQRQNAAAAVAGQLDQLADLMRCAPDEYMRQRADDFLDLKDQLLRQLLHCPKIQLDALPTAVVLVAERLTPSDTMHMDLAHIAGFVCREGGSTAHAAILARSMGIPAVMGCRDLPTQLGSETVVLLDGHTGEVILNPGPQEISLFSARKALLRAEQVRLEQYKGRPAQTRDGFSVSILANAATPEDVGAAVSTGADGVGLLRSEFLYMDRDTLPTEEEQLHFYQRALTLARGKPVTIRTLDVGGDKELPCLPLPAEENPFLGYRAIRICLDRPELFRTQLRALYRASTSGKLEIMFPMISSVEELRRAKAIARGVQQELREEGLPFDPHVPLGMMVEVPAAAVTADLFAQEADFFSIGTNDLIQYTVAADRGNKQVENLYTPYHPAVVRLIAGTIQAAAQANIPCCMCGEAAGDLQYIPILLGMGLNHFSMSVPSILKVKKTICSLTRADAVGLYQSLSGKKTADELRDGSKGSN